MFYAEDAPSWVLPVIMGPELIMSNLKDILYCYWEATWWEVAPAIILACKNYLLGQYWVLYSFSVPFFILIELIQWENSSSCVQFKRVIRAPRRYLNLACFIILFLHYSYNYIWVVSYWWWLMSVSMNQWEPWWAPIIGIPPYSLFAFPITSCWCNKNIAIGSPSELFLVVTLIYILLVLLQAAASISTLHWYKKGMPQRAENLLNWDQVTLSFQS